MAAFGGWRRAVLRSIGAPVTKRNLRLLAAWQRAEGGSARFNPLNTTQSMAGASNYNSVGVKNYRTAKQGLRATVKTLKNGNYGEIVRLLRHNANPYTTAISIGNSPWGTSGAGIHSVLSGMGGDPGGGPAVGGGVSRHSSALIQYARKFLGTPYKWGGTSPSGFDCSGFVQYLYAHFGVKIPRTTYEQVKVGKRVGRGNLRPGDILFFEPGRSGPAHEGMYIGHGQVIEAPHTGDVVKIVSLADMARADTFVTARRVGGIQKYIGKAVSADLAPAASAHDAFNNFHGTPGQATGLPAAQDFGFSPPGGFPSLPGQPEGVTSLPGMGSTVSPQSAQGWQMLGSLQNASPETRAFAQRAQLYNQIGSQ